MPVKEVTSLEQFLEIIKQDKTSVFDFWATWCGPCKAISPIFEKLSDNAETSGALDYYKVDIDEVPDIAQEVGIRAMPTFVVFKNGMKVNELVGANPPALTNLIQTAIKA